MTFDPRRYYLSEVDSSTRVHGGDLSVLIKYYSSKVGAGGSRLGGRRFCTGKVDKWLLSTSTKLLGLVLALFHKEL